ncbi:MAG: hypothetical protein PUP93_10345 [Rhizonema sp. NSF051]|nr:hypothetical protein [Rhizonema sp. NSF051]
MSDMEQILFWSCWLASLGITALLLFWSLPLSPFTHPGITPNEAVIIFLLVMVMRWLALAVVLMQVAIIWGRRLNLATRWIVGLTIVVVALHFLLGIVNLGVLNVWMSIDHTKTRANNAVYAGIYFSLPTLLLLFTASLMRAR